MRDKQSSPWAAQNALRCKHRLVCLKRCMFVWLCLQASRQSRAEAAPMVAYRVPVSHAAQWLMWNYNCARVIICV